MKITRRSFLLGSMTGGAAALLMKERALGKMLANERLPLASEQALRFPPVFAGGEIVIGQTAVNIWTDKPTTAMTFNGSFPGPTIIVRRGDTFSATVVNQLAVPSVIHWHGIIAPELMDGHPKDGIAAGKSADISFPILNRAGTYFYHSHAHRATASQVYKGLAGFFIVEDASEISLGLPTGAFDVPLLIQDRRTNANRDLVYTPSVMDTMSGYLGSEILINGTPDAYLDLNTTLYRFRLLNGSNARIYKIAFSDGMMFQVIGSDGGLLDKPVQATSAFLSPGERLDILADFSSHQVGQSLYLKSVEFPYAGMSMGGTPQGTAMNLLKLSLTGSLASGGVVPSTLAAIEKYDPAASSRTRSFTLAMSGTVHTINDKTFEMNRIDETVRLGELERWDLTNTGDETHPMHIHGLQFQMLERDGAAPVAPNDLGWKDTVMVPSLSTVSVLVRFDDYVGRYLIHCHNLEHEDSGMMLNIQVESTLGVGDERRPDTTLSIIPNPAKTQTTLRFGELESSLPLEVINMEGRTIFRTTVSKGSAEFIIDASSFAAGTYLVRLGTLASNLKVIR